MYYSGVLVEEGENGDESRQHQQRPQTFISGKEETRLLCRWILCGFMYVMNVHVYVCVYMYVCACVCFVCVYVCITARVNVCTYVPLCIQKEEDTFRSCFFCFHCGHQRSDSGHQGYMAGTLPLKVPGRPTPVVSVMGFVVIICELGGYLGVK